MALRSYLPKSLFGRALLILVLPMLLLQAVVAYIFIQRHFDAVTRQMTDAVARELRWMMLRIEGIESPLVRDRELELATRSLGMELGFDEHGKITRGMAHAFFDVTGRAVAQTLDRAFAEPVAIDLSRHERVVDVRIQTSKGTLRALIPRRRMIASRPHLLLVWMVATALALIGIAVVFLRNQIRPIRALAEAADEFGKGRLVDFRPAGAEEIRLAGAAFLDMRARIERQIEQRTKMLSGVSHDLRTPLTRMKLALEMADPGPETEELRRDVREMEHMLTEFLAFARGERGEAITQTDVVTLAEELINDARREGGQISLFTRIDLPGERLVPMRRGAIKRCLQNLIGNALTYGDKAVLSLTINRRLVEFTVEDNGPGIPPDKREEAFRPFSRLDSARNQDRGGGVGLGLSIALDIARAHGGDILLGESTSLGGLRVALRIPR